MSTGAEMDWSNFYFMTAGASATLIGLLFVAVQFKLQSSGVERDKPWHAVARSTFNIYVMLFILSALFLIPGLADRTKGFVMLIIVASGVVRVITTWLPVWRGMLQERAQRFWETAWLLAGPLAAYLALGYQAFKAYQGAGLQSVQQNIAFALVGMFVIVLRNSWNLLHEFTYLRERRSKTPK